MCERLVGPCCWSGHSRKASSWVQNWILIHRLYRPKHSYYTELSRVTQHVQQMNVANNEARVHTLSINRGTTSNFWTPGRWHVPSSAVTSEPHRRPALSARCMWTETHFCLRRKNCDGRTENNRGKCRHFCRPVHHTAVNCAPLPLGMQIVRMRQFRNDQITCLLLAQGSKGKLVRVEAVRKHDQTAFRIRSKKAHTEPKLLTYSEACKYFWKS
jgi:hypothetical protein